MNAMSTSEHGAVSQELLAPASNAIAEGCSLPDSLLILCSYVRVNE